MSSFDNLKLKTQDVDSKVIDTSFEKLVNILDDDYDVKYDEDNEFFTFDDYYDKEVFDYGAHQKDYYRRVKAFLGEHRDVCDAYEERIFKIQNTGQGVEPSADEKKDYEYHKKILHHKLRRGARANLFFLYTECIEYIPEKKRKTEFIDKANSLSELFHSCSQEHAVLHESSGELVQYCWAYERCKELEKNRDGYGDFWARNHLKTTLISILMSVQDILIDPHIAIAVVSYDNQHAQDILQDTSNYLHSLQYLFPELVPESQIFIDDRTGKKHKIRNNSSRFDVLPVKTESSSSRTRREGTMSVISKKSGNTGKHYDLIIYDDIMIASMIDKPDEIKKQVNFVKSTLHLSTARLKHGTKRRFIGTFYQDNDTWQQLMSVNMFKLRKRVFTDDGTRYGKLLFLTKTQWKTLCNSMTEEEIQSQYLLEMPQAHAKPSLPEFDLSLKRFDMNAINHMAMTPYITIDQAYTVQAYSDYTAIVVGAVTEDNYFYIFEMIRVKILPKALYDYLCPLVNKYNPKEVFIECTASRDLSFFYEQMKNSHFHFNVTPIKAHGAKNQRILQMGQLFEENRIYFRNGMEFVEVKQSYRVPPKTLNSTWVLEEEWKQFDPNTKKQQDDLLDALSYFCDDSFVKYDSMNVNRMNKALHPTFDVQDNRVVIGTSGQDDRHILRHDQFAHALKNDVDYMIDNEASIL